MVRRILLSGLDARLVAERVASYGGLRAPGPDEQVFAVAAAATGPWVAVDVPDGVHAWHLHNLALWLQGMPGEPSPTETLVFSRSTDRALDYVLHVGASTTLEGHHSDGTPIAIDAPAAVVRRGGTVAPAFIPGLTFLMSRAIPPVLVEQPLGPGFKVTLALPDMGADHNPDLREGTPPAPSAPPPPKPSLWGRLFGTGGTA
jgi:hypothetical protein